MSTDKIATATLTAIIERTKTIQNPSSVYGLSNYSTSGLEPSSLPRTSSLLSPLISRTPGPVQPRPSEAFTASNLETKTGFMYPESSSTSELPSVLPNVTSDLYPDPRWTGSLVVPTISLIDPALTTNPVTITVLPPEAILVTLTGITYTTPRYITTTSPGGSGPTIVPVIFPFTGPPIICFSCFIRFPPNIEINVPSFCIQLFGLKIGNCPADDNKSKKDDDKDDGKDDDKDDDKDDEKDEDEDDDEDEEEEEDDEDDESTTSTTSTASCTVTVTATQQTVFCSITRSKSYYRASKFLQKPKADLSISLGVNSGTPARTAASTTCLTSAYTTITGCSVLNSITTVTTIQSSVPTPYPLCDWHCDSGGCPAREPGRPGVSVRQISEVGAADKPEVADPLNETRPIYTADLAESKISRRGQPYLGEWVDPFDYDYDYSIFIREQFRLMRTQEDPRNRRDPYHETKLVMNGPRIDDPDEDASAVRSNWLVFGDTVQTLAVENLIGCTLVLVVSRRGAWMGKFFERALREDNILDQALQRMIVGPSEINDANRYWQYGIGNLINQPQHGKLGFVFGDQDIGERDELDADQDPIHALIVTPREKRFYLGPDGRAIDHSDTYSYYARAGDLSYHDSVQLLKDTLNELIPHIDRTVVDYPQVLLTVDELYAPNIDITARLQAKARDTPRGKVMLQYHPAKTCNHKASWRWWVDAMPIDAMPVEDESPIDDFWDGEPRQRPPTNLTPYPGSMKMHEWDPESDQIFARPPNARAGGPVRRQECPVRSKPASSGPTPTLSEPPPPSSHSTGKGAPGKPTSPGQGGGGTRPPPTGSTIVNGTGVPTPWNYSMTTARRGGTGTWLLPTALLSLNRTATSTLRSGLTKTTPGGNSTANLPSTTSWSLNGTAGPVLRANLTVLSSELATLNETKSMTSTALIGMGNGTLAIGTSKSQVTTSKTPSIHTTIYVAPLTWSVISSSSTTSSTSPVRRVTVTASVERSVVKTITVFTSTVTVPPPKPKPSQPPTPPKAPPKPDATEAVLIMLERLSPGAVSTEVWVMLPVKLDTSINHCEISSIGYKMISDSSSDRKSPPGIIGKNGSSAFGLKNCKYIALSANLSCDGPVKMDCVKDPEYDKVFKCYKGWDLRSYTPRVRCMIRK
ncbi:hypothetical protein LY76DRAFT_661200 [Colletotrichum caudatum]|nr:hypothetical protein LY76DRAFT_661200 [Colletotrichum caudatum]